MSWKSQKIQINNRKGSLRWGPFWCVQSHESHISFSGDRLIFIKELWFMSYCSYLQLVGEKHNLVLKSRWNINIQPSAISLCAMGTLSVSCRVAKQLLNEICKPELNLSVSIQPSAISLCALGTLRVSCRIAKQLLSCFLADGWRLIAECLRLWLGVRSESSAFELFFSWRLIAECLHWNSPRRFLLKYEK